MNELEQITQDIATNGHGHIVPRNDGHKMRCSGTLGCGICRRDQARFIAAGGYVPKPPTMSYTDFVLTRADLEVMLYGGGKWRAAIAYTLPNNCEGRGETREAALRETYSKWVKCGCPDSVTGSQT